MLSCCPSPPLRNLLLSLWLLPVATSPANASSENQSSTRSVSLQTEHSYFGGRLSHGGEGVTGPNLDVDVDVLQQQAALQG